MHTLISWSSKWLRTKQVFLVNSMNVFSRTLNLHHTIPTKFLGDSSKLESALNQMIKSVIDLIIVSYEGRKHLEAKRGNYRNWGSLCYCTDVVHVLQDLQQAGLEGYGTIVFDVGVQNIIELRNMIVHGRFCELM